MKTIGITTRQAAKQVDLTVRTIQYYCDEEIVLPDLANVKGRGVSRRYSQENIVELFIVRHLRELGLNLATIKKVMSIIRDARKRGQRWWTERMSKKDSLEKAWIFIYDPGSENVDVKFKTGMDAQLYNVQGKIITFSEYLEAADRSVIVVIHLSEMMEKIIRQFST